MPKEGGSSHRVDVPDVGHTMPILMIYCGEHDVLPFFHSTQGELDFLKDHKAGNSNYIAGTMPEDRSKVPGGA